MTRRAVHARSRKALFGTALLIRLKIILNLRGTGALDRHLPETPLALDLTALVLRGKRILTLRGQRRSFVFSFPYVCPGRAKMLRKAALAFWLVLCICLMIVPLAAQAQKPATVYRIGWLSPEAAADPFALNLLDIFEEELRALGYVQGKNLVIDIRRAEGKNELLPGLAAELVALKP